MIANHHRFNNYYYNLLTTNLLKLNFLLIYRSFLYLYEWGVADLCANNKTKLI
ncbi:hypothetical protein BH11BAC3_BH11BAC3_26060 [soil metagenome]